MKPRLRSLVSTAVLAVAALLALAAPTLAAPTVDLEVGLSTNPKRIALGPDGSMWVTLVAGNEIAKIAPDGTVTEYDIDTLGGATGITAGPLDRMWVTIGGKLGHFDPDDPQGTAATFPVTDVGQGDIAAGPDGNLWTPNLDKLVRITPTGDATTFTILTNASRIAAGDGVLWIADFGGGELLSVMPDGTPTRYPTGGSPQGVAVGLNGQIGYTNPGTDPHTVGRLITGGSPLPTPVTPGVDPFGIAFGADQAYWFAQPFGNNLGRLTADGSYSELGGFSAEAGPRFVAAGPSNTLWVTLEGLNGNEARKVARVSGLEPPTPQPPPLPPETNRRPMVSGLAVVPRVFRVGKARTPVVAQRKRTGRRKAAPVGTTIRFRLSEAADVRLTFERRLPGRRVGRRCVKPTRANRGRKRCVRFVRRGVLRRRNLAAGAQRIAFSGRIGRRALAPGRYRVTVVATDDGGAYSVARRAAFRIVALRPR